MSYVEREAIDEIEATNVLWLEYMNKGNRKLYCPEGHTLYKYTVDHFKYIITCPIAECQYYDYHTYRLTAMDERSADYPRLTIFTKRSKYS